MLKYRKTWMDFEVMVQSKVSQTEKGRYHVPSLICRIHRKMIHMNLFSRQKQTHRHRKQTYGSQRGKWGINRYTILYIK